MRDARIPLALRAERPQLQGPGVLRKRFVRRAPEAAPEATASASAAPAEAPPRGLLNSGGLVPLFITLLVICQLALLIPALAPLRVVVRSLAFGCSLALLACVPGRGLKHPALPFVLGALVVTVLNFFHPGTSGTLAAIVQLAIQASIIAPLLWVTRLRIDTKLLQRTLVLLFLFNTASAGVGVLQVYFPGRFQPALSTVISNQGDQYVRGLQFETPTGEKVFRPMGLTDTPSGAATGAFYAVVLGSGFLLASRAWLQRALGMSGILLGLVCLYLCQVRAIALMLLVCLLAMAAVLALGGRLGRMALLLGLAGGGAVLAFGWAVAMGGGAVLARWSTLLAAEPTEVYQSNRGRFVEGALTAYLPEFPLGAGLGRYGMANAYFGEAASPEQAPLWAEVQWAAWVFDGGVLVLALYPLGLLATLWWVFRLARSHDPREGELWLWASVIFAYDLGALALTFSYPIFMSQTGMEFWLLNATLFGAWKHATVHAHRG